MFDIYKLKCIRDGKEIILDKASTLIGRSEFCDITVSTGHASREHARLLEKEDGIYIQDLHSTNGTYLNEKQVQSTMLVKVGDVFRVGEESFSLQKQNDGEATVFMRPQGNHPSANLSASVLDESDPEDEDCTSVLQVYSLPAGWDKNTELDGHSSPVDEKKQQAIDAYVDKFKSSMKGRKGLAVFVFIKDEPPEIYTISTNATEQNWSMGRGDENDLCIHQSAISVKHALIKFNSGEWVISDKKSTNGLWVEGKRLSDVLLKDGLRVVIGELELLVHLVTRP